MSEEKTNRRIRFYKWYKIGSGKKFHVMKDGSNYSVCGIGGALSGPFYAESYARCKMCEKRLWMKQS